MHKKIVLALMIFLVISACNMQGGSATPTPVGPTSVSPTSVNPTSVGPTSVIPTSVIPTPVSLGFTNVSTSFAQLSDGSTAIQFKGGDIKNADGSTTTLDPFWISSSPITNQQYELCVAAGICSPPDGTDNPEFITPAGDVFPVTGVTVQQAQDYCTWQGGALPTSAQSKQSDEGTLQYLEFLFAVHTQGFTFLPLGSGNEHEASTCDFLPPGTGGCPVNESPEEEFSPCDFVPTGTAGCPPNEPPIGACDLLPGGCSNNEQTEEQSWACNFLPAGSEGCPDTTPSSEEKISTCDLMPGGCPPETEASTENEITACDLMPGGCSEEAANTLSTLLVGLLSGPKTSLYGYFSDDGGEAAYTSPAGKIITVDANIHDGNVSFKCVIPNPKIYAPYCQSAAYIPSAKGSYPPPVCKNVTVDSTGTYCSSKLPFVNVNVSQGSDFVWAEPAPANCSIDPLNSTAENDRFICTGPQTSKITIHGQTQCSAPADWNPEKTCLDGYTYDAAANMCTYTGAQSDTQNCPSGFAYSPAAMCCVAANNYEPVCAPGYYNSPLGCLEYSSTYLTVDTTVDMPTCQNAPANNGNNNGPSCNVTCGPGEVLDIASCSCNPYKP